MFSGRARVPLVSAIRGSIHAERLHGIGRAVADVLARRGDTLVAGGFEQPPEHSAPIGICHPFQLPEAFADVVEAAEETDVRPLENQAAVLDTCGGEDPPRTKRALDLEETVEWSLERFEDRMTETRVEASVGHSQRMDVAHLELDVAYP